MEAVGEGGTEALDVALEEAAEGGGGAGRIEVKVRGTSLVAGRPGAPGADKTRSKNTPPRGKVTLRARRRHRRGTDRSRRHRHRDHADEVKRIFERFSRGSGSLERQGFGLGLSIARRMVDVMGGEPEWIDGGGGLDLLGASSCRQSQPHPWPANLPHRAEGEYCGSDEPGQDP